MSRALANTRNRMIAVSTVITTAIVIAVMAMVNRRTKSVENTEEKAEKQPIIQFSRLRRRKVS